MSDRRILIVDDEEAVCTVIERAFETLDFKCEVRTAANPFTALEQLQQYAFDLVITDHRMPQMDGIELITIIRQINPQTGIILMTGYGTDALRQKAEALQIDGYLAKPFHLAHLLELIHAALAKRTGLNPASKEFSRPPAKKAPPRL
jgi:CheY-like chemotaxis protein